MRIISVTQRSVNTLFDRVNGQVQFVYDFVYIMFNVDLLSGLQDV